MFFQWDVLKNTDSFVVKDPTDHLATQPPGAGRGCRQRWGRESWGGEKTWHRGTRCVLVGEFPGFRNVGLWWFNDDEWWTMIFSGGFISVGFWCWMILNDDDGLHDECMIYVNQDLLHMWIIIEWWRMILSMMLANDIGKFGKHVFCVLQ